MFRKRLEFGENLRADFVQYGGCAKKLYLLRVVLAWRDGLIRYRRMIASAVKRILWEVAKSR